MDTPFSVIIPYRSDGGQRDRLRAWCIARWQALFPEAEIVSEDDGNVGLFNRSMSINRCVDKASHDILFVTDGDVLADVEQVREAIRLVQLPNVPYVHPFTVTKHLNRQVSEAMLLGPVDFEPPSDDASIDREQGQGIWDHTNRYDDCSHQWVITREAFERAGRCDERFSGWGFEDTAFAHAANTLVGLQVKVNHTLIHLWHAYAGGKASSEHAGYANNFGIFAMYKHAQGDMVAMRRCISKTRMEKQLCVLSGEPHYSDHLLAAWKTLPDKMRGVFVTRDHRVEGSVMVTTDAEIVRILTVGTPVMVASIDDMRMAAKCGAYVVLMQHGAGQSYGTTHASYPGGEDRTGVVLELVPNQQAKARNLARHPEIPCEVVGSARVKALQALPGHSHHKPVVCLSFHWDAPASACVAQEARSAWTWYKDALEQFQSKDWALIAHAHPRMAATVRPACASLGIPFIDAFEDVVKLADVYCCDNSSTIFEFAALNRPVVLLNAPWYRKDVEHGLRFWRESSIGVQCETPAEVQSAIRRAIEDDASQQMQRHASVNRVYSQECSLADALTAHHLFEGSMMNMNNAMITVVIRHESNQGGGIRRVGERYTTDLREAQRLVVQGYASFQSVAPEEPVMETEVPVDEAATEPDSEGVTLVYNCMDCDEKFAGRKALNVHRKLMHAAKDQS